MFMFMGEFQHSVDAKGRLIIPAKFREGLGERFIATRGLERNVYVFPMSEFEALAQKLKTYPLASGNARDFSRMLFSGAAECELDPQGRINLPQNLRTYAGLEKDVVVVGVDTRVEVWSQPAWEEYCQKAEPNFAEIGEKLMGI